MLCVAVMLSVMVLGAGAAFSDQDQIENTEAVDACSALNIIGGYEDGSFHPERNIKRSEITKMICVALNGGKDPNVSTNAVPTFSDVRGTSAEWAEGYIEACVAQGIVSGVGGGRFSPDGNVTGAQLAKMLLVCLGYNSDNEGFTGNAWETNVNVRAAQKHLYDGLESMDTSAAVTRDQAAQMVWNAMNAYEVEYKTNLVTDENGNLTTQVVVEDKLDANFNRITLLADKYEVVVNVGTLVGIDGKVLNIAMSDSDVANSDQPEYREFLDLDVDYSALMGQKVKVMFKVDKPNDVLGVYATSDNTVITVNQKEIGTDGEKVSFGGNSYALESEGVSVYIDGQQQDDTMRANYFKAPQSANVITFVDVDGNNKFDAACIQEVTVAEVTYVSDTQIIAGGLTYKFADDNIAEGVAKEDWVVITRNLYNDNNDIAVVEPITGTVDSIKTGATYYQYEIGGTWYNEAPNARRNNDIKSTVKAGVDVEAIVVNGLVFAAEKTSGEAGKLNDILFVTYIETNGLNAKTASVMYPDGTKATIKLDSYNTDDTAAAPIQVGAYYEYSKSGDTYKLRAVDQTDDAYGEFTNIDNPAEALTSIGTNGATVDPEAGTYDGAMIADTANVIVYQPVTDTGALTGVLTGYNVKHITGKQFKASFESDANSAKYDVDANGLGAFTSQVNGLTRVSSLAVLYTGVNFDGDMSGIGGSSFYGYVTKDAVKKVVGGVDGIEMYVWTGTENVKVFADTTKDSDYVAGTIVGYDSIAADENGNNIISGLTDLDADTVDSISEVGVAGDADTIRLANGGEIDLGDFDTVLYMNTTVEDENGAQSGVVNGTPSVANEQQGVRPTNFISVNNDVAVIDSNAFVSGPYAAALGYDLPGTVGGNDVQWVDNRTQDNTPNSVYPGALVDLTFKVPAAGDLTITNVTRNDNGTQNPTYTFSAAQVGTDVTIKGLLVTNDVTFTWNAGTAGGSDAESAKALNDAMASAAGMTYEYTGEVPTDGIINVPAAKILVLKNATMNGANIAGNVEVDGTLTIAGANGISGKLTLNSSTDTISAFPNATLAAGSIEDTATDTSAAKVTELLGYSKNVTVKEISSCADIDIAAGKTVTADKVTFSAMPTNIAGTLTATTVDASAVVLAAGEVTDLLAYTTTSLKVGDVDMATETAATVAAGKTLTVGELTVDTSAALTVDGTLVADSITYTSGVSTDLATGLIGTGKISVGNASAVTISDYKAVVTAMDQLNTAMDTGAPTNDGSAENPWEKDVTNTDSATLDLVTFTATGTTVSATIVDDGVTTVDSIDTTTALGTITAEASGGTIADGTLKTTIQISSGDYSETVYVTFTLS